MALIAQSGPYIPRRDAGARDWLNNFAAVVAADPAAVGLTPADAAVLRALADAFDAAYERAVNPDTRTSAAIADKDAVRNQALATFRIYAMRIKANLGVSDRQKLELGIHLDDRTLTPIPAPTTVPLLSIVSAYSRTHRLRYADSQTPSAIRKPPGAVQLLLFVVLGDEPTADPLDENAIHVGAFTKQPFEVMYQPEHVGRTATYFGRWITRTGKTGPWSLPVAMMIA